MNLGATAIKELDPGLIQGTEAEKQQWRANFATLHRPKIKLSLFHEATDGDDTLLRTPLGADELRYEKDKLISPRPDPVTLELEPQFELPEPKLENATLVWSTTFVIQRGVLDGLGRGRIVAYLEEVDRRMPATYRTEPVLPKTMFSADTFVESGPRFSARVPFIETN